ncbi:hypothetical protein KCV07_g256, partial [Aureobasidium melanogenum]
MLTHRILHEPRESRNSKITKRTRSLTNLCTMDLSHEFTMMTQINVERITDKLEASIARDIWSSASHHECPVMMKTLAIIRELLHAG